jgi:hypothetical protein
MTVAYREQLLRKVLRILLTVLLTIGGVISLSIFGLALKGCDRVRWVAPVAEGDHRQGDGVRPSDRRIRLTRWPERRPAAGLVGLYLLIVAGAIAAALAYQAFWVRRGGASGAAIG